MKNEEIEKRFSAIENSIAELRKDVDALLLDKQNRDKVENQFKLITVQMSEFPDSFVQVVKELLS